eukprot:7005040-Prorocentrum_lima.AAC.1
MALPRRPGAAASRHSVPQSPRQAMWILPATTLSRRVSCLRSLPPRVLTGAMTNRSRKVKTFPRRPACWCWP